MAARTKWAAFGCLHLPVHCESYRQWRLDQIREHKPDYVICLGDQIDADGASRWENENDWTLQTEYTWLAKDFREIEEAAPGAKLVWVQGNHDANLEEPGRISPKLRAASNWRYNIETHWIADRWKIVPYGARERFRLGPITFLHGAQIGINADRNNALLYGTEWGLTIGVHTHKLNQIQRVVLPGAIPLNRWFVNCGTGADWDQMKYVNRLNIATWGRGMVIGDCAGADQRRAAYMSRQWDAALLVHSQVA